jgi:hypothetical protein
MRARGWGGATFPEAGGMFSRRVDKGNGSERGGRRRKKKKSGPSKLFAFSIIGGDGGASCLCQNFSQCPSPGKWTAAAKSRESSLHGSQRGVRGFGGFGRTSKHESNWISIQRVMKPSTKNGAP